MPASIFGTLAGKDAPGSCAKCHSVDETEGGERRMSFKPSSFEHKRGSFTRFAHEPHLSISGRDGCLGCHELDKRAGYLASYEQSDPLKFVSGFVPVKKERCATCHTAGKARQDCLLCHRYHIHGTLTPAPATRLPSPAPATASQPP